MAFSGSEATAHVVIAGGGPAGTTLAIHLARLGHDVILVAAPAAHRPHQVETFGPAVAEQLRFRGLGQALDHALIQMADFEIKWGGGGFEPREPGQPGFVVDRARFDAALLALTRKSGARVLIGQVSGAACHAKGSWHITLSQSSDVSKVTGDLLIDTSGRRGVLPKQRRRGPRLAGIHGMFCGPNVPAEVRIASAAHHWVWGAPAGEDCYAVTVFLDPANLHATAGTLAVRFQALVYESGLARRDGRENPSSGPVRAIDATPYLDLSCAGAGFFKVGEAALAVDPLSSAGVQIALQSAAAAAAAVHTVSLDPDAFDLVRGFWSRSLARRHTRHAAWSAAFYAEGSARFSTQFWSSRASTMPDASRRDNPWLTKRLCQGGLGNRFAWRKH